jgi:hypothetical protein
MPEIVGVRGALVYVRLRIVYVLSLAIEAKKPLMVPILRLHFISDSRT